MAIIVYHLHLTLDNYIRTKTSINSNLPLTEIDASINKNLGPISREMKNH